MYYLRCNNVLKQYIMLRKSIDPLNIDGDLICNMGISDLKKKIVEILSSKNVFVEHKSILKPYGQHSGFNIISTNDLNIININYRSILDNNINYYDMVNKVNK